MRQVVLARADLAHRRTVHRSSQTDARLGALTWLSALVGFTVFLFAPQVLNDGDTYSHIATGEWILMHRAMPSADPFSYTFAGAPWVAHEWLSELVMGLAFRLGAWSGVLVLFAGATSLALVILARYLGRWLDLLPAAITLLLAASCVSPDLLARPHILVLPILELWTIGLLKARDRTRVPWPILPLMLAWANMHGSFIFGLMLVCPFALEATLAAGAEWHSPAFQWGLFLASATLLALVTPFGWHGLTFSFQLLSMKQLGSIEEWHATDFQTVQPIELALMTVLYVCLSRGVRVPVLRLVVLLGLLHLALQHTRQQMLAGVVGALILAEPLGRGLGVMPVSGVTPNRSRILLVACFLAPAALLTALRMSQPVVRVDGVSSPVTALEHVPGELAGSPVLNDYGFGGYLIFQGIRPFIDGRADMYGDAFLTDYAEIMRPDRALLARTLDERGIRWTILRAASPALEVMDTLPGWHRLFADKVAVVHARAAGQ
jgi:hypothetical protein